MFSLIWAWINRWVNNCEAGDLGRHCAHYDVIVMHYVQVVNQITLYVCLRALAIQWNVPHVDVFKCIEYMYENDEEISILHVSLNDHTDIKSLQQVPETIARKCHLCTTYAIMKYVVNSHHHDHHISSYMVGLHFPKFKHNISSNQRGKFIPKWVFYIPNSYWGTRIIKLRDIFNQFENTAKFYNRPC